jgi:putative ABC transport system permease protein
MIKLFGIAFRNVFRNFSRSMLTIFITAVSVTFLIFCSSFLDGAITSFLNENIKLTGHVRITAPNYGIYEKMLSLNHNVSNYQQFKTIVRDRPGMDRKIAAVTGVIKFGVVVFQGEQNRESVGFGIEPEYSPILGLDKAIYQGRIFNARAEDEMVIGRRLAENLKIKVNSKITLLVRTVYNAVSLVNYKVVGVFDLQNGQLNKGIYLPLPAAQQLLDLDGKVTEVMAFGKAISDTGYLLEQFQKMPAAAHLELKTWDSIGAAPSFLGLINIIAKTILIIIVILAGLGITNTMLMAIMERRKEIGILKSLGMYEGEIVTLFTIEGVILGLSGLIIGLILGGGSAYLLAVKGIHFGSALQGVPFATTETVYGAFNSGIFIRAIALSIIAGFCASLFPSIRGVRVKLVEALK